MNWRRRVVVQVVGHEVAVVNEFWTVPREESWRYTGFSMVWTEVSWLLAAVATVVILVPLIAILFTQIRGPDATLPRVYHRGLPDDAELPDGDRIKAMHRFALERGEGNRPD